MMANFARVAPGVPVFGVCRPNHFGDGLDAWVGLLEGAGIDRVVCLLSTPEAARWGLPGAYADHFETAHHPIRDRHLPDERTLTGTLEELRAAEAAGQSTTLHCNAGLGRTGVVAAAWLTRERDYDPLAAIETLEAAGRSPREAVRCANATEAELLELLEG